MNYLLQIRAFYDWLETNPLPAQAIALWHALMYQNNKCRWAEEFAVPVVMLESRSGLSRSAVYRARNQLKQHGLIDFKSSGANKAALYRVFQLDTYGEGQSAPRAGRTPEQSPAALKKQNETKQTKKNIGKDFSPPSLEQVASYCKEKKLSVEPESFFDYFSAADWVDSRGNPVLSWEQKLLTWNTYQKQRAPRNPEPQKREKDHDYDMQQVNRALFGEDGVW